MNLFVDASALVAILAREPEAGNFVDEIGEASASYSAIAQWETTNALCRIDPEFTLEQARHAILDFAALYEMELVAIGAEEAKIAAEAFATYGKGRHPAKLNMGDCFAYACAKANNARLLYKGDDFSHTDLA